MEAHRLRLRPAGADSGIDFGDVDSVATGRLGAVWLKDSFVFCAWRRWMRCAYPPYKGNKSTFCRVDKRSASTMAWRWSAPEGKEVRANLCALDATFRVAMGWGASAHGSTSSPRTESTTVRSPPYRIRGRL